MTQPDRPVAPAGDEPRPTVSDDARLESLMAEVPPSPPGWSAPPSRTPSVALWLGVGAFVAALAVVLDLASVRQGQRSIVHGSVLAIVLLAGLGLAVAAITAGLRVRSQAASDASDRTRAAIAIGLSAAALVLMTLGGLELYSIGLDAF